MYEIGLGDNRVRAEPRFGSYPSFGLGAPPKPFALSGPAPITYIGDTLRPGKWLSPNQGLKSKNGRVKVVLQTDGNCVLYGDGVPLWWTGVRPGVNRAYMQGDGNFVIYIGAGGPSPEAVWASNTEGHPGGFLVAQDDGNLVLYWGVGGSALWSSETNGFRYYGGPGHGIQFEDVLEIAGDVLMVAQVVISFVPGVGAGINAAIAAGGALARGENISDAVVSAAKNALPGGPIAAKAFDVAWSVGKSVAAGVPLDEAAVAATRAALPDGAAQTAFDTALALAHAQNAQQALLGVTKSLAPEAGRAAAALFKDPDLLKLPIAEAAKLLHSDPASVQAAKVALDSNKTLHPPATEKRMPPQLKQAPPPPGPDPKLVANLAAVARAKPQAKDAEVLYVAVAGDDVISRNANRLSPKLISNMIAVARHFPNAKDAEVLYVASLPPELKKPPQLKEAAPMPPKTAPTPAAPQAVAHAYGPYPKNMPAHGLSAPPMHPHHVPQHGGHHGGGGFRPSTFRGGRGGPGWWWDVPWSPTVVTATETCRVWGNPVALPPDMVNAARTALNVSKGQPTTVRGPDNVLYLFSFENGALTARPCAAVAVG